MAEDNGGSGFDGGNQSGGEHEADPSGGNTGGPGMQGPGGIDTSTAYGAALANALANMGLGMPPGPSPQIPADELQSTQRAMQREFNPDWGDQLTDFLGGFLGLNIGYQNTLNGGARVATSFDPLGLASGIVGGLPGIALSAANYIGNKPLSMDLTSLFNPDAKPAAYGASLPGQRPDYVSIGQDLANRADRLGQSLGGGNMSSGFGSGDQNAQLAQAIMNGDRSIEGYSPIEGGQQAQPFGQSSTQSASTMPASYAFGSAGSPAQASIGSRLPNTVAQPLNVPGYVAPGAQIGAFNSGTTTPRMTGDELSRAMQASRLRASNDIGQASLTGNLTDTGRRAMMPNIYNQFAQNAQELSQYPTGTASSMLPTEDFQPTQYYDASGAKQPGYLEAAYRAQGVQNTQDPLRNAMMQHRVGGF